MANTTNFNWETPDDTDLVKDGAAAIRTLGSSIDTSFVDLKGGTTGQILSKASNTDLDYTWIANDVGDITNVGVTAPITGGGSSGSVTIGIDDGTTAQKGAVQLEDSTSSTSTTKAATPNSVKSAYDLANAAIAKSLIDAEGDLIVGDAADAVQRLAIGSNGNVLTVDTAVDGKIKWATPAGGSTFAGCSLKSSTTSLSVANATTTVLTWDEEYFDSDGYHSTSSNTSRITIPSGKGGYYLFVHNQLAANPNASRSYNYRLYKNGAQVRYIETQSGALTTGYMYWTQTWVIDGAVGDYFEVYVTQNTTGSVNYYFDGLAAGLSNFSCTYLGA